MNGHHDGLTPIIHILNITKENTKGGNDVFNGTESRSNQGAL